MIAELQKQLAQLQADRDSLKKKGLQIASKEKQFDADTRKLEREHKKIQDRLKVDIYIASLQFAFSHVTTTWCECSWF